MQQLRLKIEGVHHIMQHCRCEEEKVLEKLLVAGQHTYRQIRHSCSCVWANDLSSSWGFDLLLLTIAILVASWLSSLPGQPPKHPHLLFWSTFYMTLDFDLVIFSIGLIPSAPDFLSLNINFHFISFNLVPLQLMTRNFEMIITMAPKRRFRLPHSYQIRSVVQSFELGHFLPVMRRPISHSLFASPKTLKTLFCVTKIWCRWKGRGALSSPDQPSMSWLASLTIPGLPPPDKAGI